MTTATKTIATDSAIYWNEQGQIRCAKHAPYRGSDTWRYERWTKVPASALPQIRAQFEIPADAPLCEACRG